MILSGLMALHLAGLAFWLVGALALTRALGTSLEPALWRWAWVGAALAVAGGAGLLAAAPSHFLAEGWLKAKLYVSAGALAATAALAYARGGKIRPFWPRRALAACGLLALLLSCLRPF